jgi:hypothetical protein
LFAYSSFWQISLISDWFAFEFGAGFFRFTFPVSDSIVSRSGKSATNLHVRFPHILCGWCSDGFSKDHAALKALMFEERGFFLTFLAEDTRADSTTTIKC